MRQALAVRSNKKKSSHKQDFSPALAPTNVLWSSPDPHTLVVTWVPATDPDSAIQYHEISVDGADPVRANSPTGTTITALSRRTTYSVRVRGVSAGGPSDWAEVQATTVYAYTYPGFPAALDDNDADMRPQSGVSWQKTVAQDGSGDYTSLKTAVDDAHYAVGQRTFNQIAAIIVKPGTYEQTDVTIADYVAVIGATGDPKDVVIVNVTYNDSTLGRGAMDTWGSSYVAHVTLKRVDVDFQGESQLGLPKYSVHGTSGKCSMWVNCIFDVGESTNNIGIPSVFGQDGNSGNYTLFYRCKFIGNRSDSDTNIHGGSNVSTDPETVLFVRCEFENSHILDEDKNAPNALGAGYKPMSSDHVGDILWIVDCVGLKYAITGTACQGLVVHKPESVLLQPNAPAPAHVDTRQDWPMPIDWKLT